MGLLSRIVACLGEKNDGQVEFVESPLPLVRQILDLESEQQRQTLLEVAEFGLFLEKKKQSPQAASILLGALEAVSQQILREATP